jgi:hypothetical protein
LAGTEEARKEERKERRKEERDEGRKEKERKLALAILSFIISTDCLAHDLCKGISALRDTHVP